MNVNDFAPLAFAPLDSLDQLLAGLVTWGLGLLLCAAQCGSQEAVWRRRFMAPGLACLAVALPIWVLS